MPTKRHAAGISVIEVMIALGIAVIIVISVGSLIISTHSLDTEASKQLQAVGFAKEWLEVVDVQRNTYFGCSCGAACTTCTAADSQACTPRSAAGYWSCWVGAPLSLIGEGPFRLVPNGGTWDLQAGTDVPAVDFIRTMSIINQQRDASGAIVSSGGTVDPNTKLITVTVQWLRAGSTRQVQLSKIVTAWKNF